MKTLLITTKTYLILWVLYSLFTVNHSFAQELSFAKGFGGASAETVTDIDIDPNGNIYLMGTFRGTVDFDPGEGITELSTSDRRAIYVAKFNPSGELIWAKQIGAGKADFGVSSTILNGKLEVDNSGNVYLCGQFAYRADFDPGPGTTTLTPVGTSQGPSDIFFSKWDTDGNLVWVKQIGGTSATDDLANDIALAPNGNIFITGAYRGTVDFDPGAGTNNLSATVTTGYVAEYTTNGEYVWAGGLFRAQTADPVFEGSTIAISSSGSIFVGGYIKTGQFSSIGYISNISSSYNLLRYWEYESTGVTNPTAYINDLSLDAGNNLYATGSFSGTLSGMVSAGSSDVLLVNILSNGAELWRKQVGGANFDQGLGISVGQAGEVYIIGQMGGTGDFDPGPEELLLTGTSFITAIDDNGDLYRSAKAIDVNSSGGVPGGFSAISALNGKIYLGGTYQSGDDLDPSSETLTLPFQGTSDAFLSVFTPEPVSIIIDENTPNGTVVATNVGGTAIVSGNTDGAFELVNSSIRVANQDALDFETNPTFRLTISSSGGNQIYVITLNDLDESPSIQNQQYTIISSISNGDAVGTITATDPNGDNLTFSITSGNDNNIFSLNTTSGILSVADRSLLDFSQPNSIDLEVTVSDGTETASATISIKLNIAPAFSWSETNFAYDEGIAWTLSVPVADPESDQLQMSIVSGNDAGLLTISNPTANVFELRPVDQQNGIDFEADQSAFEIVVSAEDAFGNSTNSNPISISINNINDNAPTLENQEVTISERSPNGSSVITLAGVDADGDALSYTLASGNTDNAFALDPNTGEVTVNNSDALLFDVNPTFTLTINVSDGELTSDATITIDLTQSTAPIIEAQTFTIVNTIEQGDVVGQIEAFDAQGDPLDYNITSGDSNGVFSLNSTTGVLTLADRAALDFTTPNSFDLGISVSDGTEESNATISVILDIAPTFDWAATSFSFDENQQWFLQVPVTDPESDDLTLSIVSGDENSILSVLNTAAVGATPLYEVFPTDMNGIDFETGPQSFELTILATDGAGNEVTSELISIVINNINDNAPVAQNQTLSRNQNLPDGQLITTITATDADGDESFTYEIAAGNTDNAFEIGSASGELIVANSAALNFSSNPVFSLEITISDGELSGSVLITINLNEQDINTAPVIDDQILTIEENSQNGTLVGEVSAVDFEGDQLTYSIVSGNENNAFILSSSSGELIVNNSEALDFEATTFFDLLIRVSDGEFTEVGTVTVTVLDVEDSNTSPAIENQQFTVNENSPAGTIIGTVVATDGENDPLTFTIASGNESGVFSLGSGTGELSVLDPIDLDFERNPVFELTVDVSDNEFTSTATITVQLIDEEEEAVLGIQEEIISIYPNPTADFFIVDALENVDEISIRELSGRQIRRYKSNSHGRYSVEGLMPGLYMIVIRQKRNSVIRKLIVE
jgi:hypothetical protein